MAAIAVVVLVAVGWWLLRPAPAPTEASLPLAPGASGVASVSSEAGGSSSGSNAGATSAPVSSTTTAPPLVVQAAGAVRSPGLYRLDAGARVDDLIRAAGGLDERADRDRINLAAPLADGQRVWLPIRGEAEVPTVVAGGGGGGAPSSGSSTSPAGPAAGSSSGAGSGSSDAGPSAPVDLNTADAAALDELPGVGPATAAAILTYREQSGPFRSVEDLLEVPGIGDAKLAQLRDLVAVG